MRSHLSCERGNIALAFALLAPVLIGAAGAAIDFARYSSIRSELQEIADSAALAGAREYLTNRNAADIAEKRAEYSANSLLQRAGGLDGASAFAEADDQQASVSVKAEFSYRPTLLVALYQSPLQIEVNSLAQVSGGANVCVLGLEETAGDTVYIEDNARLTGVDCSVYSNSTDPKGLLVKSSGFLDTAFNCSAGGYGENDRHFSSPPLPDCPKRDDPLAGRIEPAVGGCDHQDLTFKDHVGRIFPGVYCGGLIVDDASRVTLDAGIYVFKDGPFEVKSISRVDGDGVGLFFTGVNAGIKFEGKSAISLAAPETGAMAGVLIWQSKGVTGIDKFEIYSNFVDRLVGTIYLPDAEFIAAATAEVAEESAYTAIIAKKITLRKNTRLVLNTDYTRTSVPVPAGIANAGGALHLRR